jgi:hypothetical protein
LTVFIIVRRNTVDYRRPILTSKPPCYSWLVCALVHVFGAQWLGDPIFFLNPFPEINQFATVRAKRAVLSLEPVSLLLASRAFDFPDGFHANSSGE